MSDRNAVLVTGATGKVGRHLLPELLRREVAVRAITRDPASAELPAGVEPVPGDLSAPESMDAVLSGGGPLFLLWPPAIDVEKNGPALLRAAAARSRHVVYLSSGRIRDDLDQQSDPISQAHAEMESMIRHSGLEWTFLRPSGFASNTLRWASDIRSHGVVRGPFGEVTRSLVDERDIAAVAACALTEPGHNGATYLLTGPQRLSHIEQVRIIGEVLRRRVDYTELSPDEAREEMRTSMPDSVVETILKALAEMRAEPEPVTRTVEEVTGTPARTFREWVWQHADAFR